MLVPHERLIIAKGFTIIAKQLWDRIHIHMGNLASVYGLKLSLHADLLSP
jgi:hypothetical protein